MTDEPMVKKAPLPIANQLSTGAILYFFRDGKPHIVLLTQNGEFYHKSTNDVDIGPSGGMEGTDEIKSAKREIKEETGLEPELDTRFAEDTSYEFNAPAREGPYKGQMARIRKTRRYYLAGISEDDLKKIRLSPEHTSWSAIPLQDALESPDLKPNQKELLQKALAYLSTISRS